MMKPGSKIIVTAGNSLEIKGATSIFGCDQMWQGIHLEEGASLTMDNSTIEDAQYAIKAIGNSTLDITGSNFNNNFIGIYVENPYGGAGYVGNTTFTALSGNTFDGGGGLLAPFTGQSGDPVGTVGSEAFAGIWIDNPSLMVHSMGNTFKNMSNGIYARNTSLKVTGCTFENIQENSYPSFMSGYGIRAAERRGTKTFQQSGFGSGAGSSASFQNCAKGIYVFGMQVDYIKDNLLRTDRGIELVFTQQKGKVAGNTIGIYKGNSVGIAIRHPSPSAKMEVIDNEIELIGTAINSTAIQYTALGLEPQGGGEVAINSNDIVLGAAGNRGIHLTSSNSALLQQNNVTLQAGATNALAYSINNDYKSLLNCNDATGIDGADGIGFDVWDAENTKYHCNDFSNMTTGVYFQMGSPSANNFKENEFSGGDVGLRISGNAAIGSQSQKGNRWTGGFGNVAALHESMSAGDWGNSPFIVHQSTGSYYPSQPSYIPAGDWFSIDEFGTPNDDCSGWVTCVVEAEDPDDDGLFLLDGSIVNGNFQVSEYPTEIGWLAKRYTFRKLAKDPSLAAPGSVYEAFYNNESNSIVGKFVDINLNTSNIFQVDSITQYLINNEQTTINLSMDSIAVIDSQLIDGYDSLLIQQRSIELQNVKNAESNLETLIDPIIAQQITNVDGIISQNAAGTTSLIFETNKKTVNNIYLNTVVKGEVDLTSQQLSDLQSIAFQCPFTGGSAVYEARSLLALEMDTVYNDNLLCASAQGLKKNDKLTTTDHEGFHLYPNPAKDQVTLLLPDDIANGKVVLVNAQGAIVTTMKLESESRSAIINTDQLVKGIYLLNVFDNNRKVYSEKLIVIH